MVRGLTDGYEKKLREKSDQPCLCACVQSLLVAGLTV
jgi:hypothetical protein